MFQALWFSHSCFCVMHTIVSILMLKYIVYCLQVLGSSKFKGAGSAGRAGYFRLTGYFGFRQIGRWGRVRAPANDSPSKDYCQVAGGGARGAI